jgi:multiple sugar transport system permease protein
VTSPPTLSPTGARAEGTGPPWRPGRLATAYVLGATLVFLAPMLATLGLAFTDYTGITAPRFVGLDNLRALSNDPAARAAAVTTAWLVLLIVPARLALATVAALVTFGPRRGAARTAVFLPSTVPDAAWALLWLWLLNPLYGPVASLLGTDSGVLTQTWPTRIGLAVMIAIQVGETFVVCLAARGLVPSSAYDAARVEGASRWHATRRITLPLMAPALGFLAVRDTIVVATALFVPILVLTDGGPRESTTSAPVYLYEQGFRYGEFGYVSAAGLLLTGAALALGLVLTLVVTLSLRTTSPRRRG